MKTTYKIAIFAMLMVFLQTGIAQKQDATQVEKVKTVVVTNDLKHDIKDLRQEIDTALGGLSLDVKERDDGSFNVNFSVGDDKLTQNLGPLIDDIIKGHLESIDGYTKEIDNGKISIIVNGKMRSTTDKSDFEERLKDAIQGLANDIDVDIDETANGVKVEVSALTSLEGESHTFFGKFNEDDFDLGFGEGLIAVVVIFAVLTLLCSPIIIIVVIVIFALKRTDKNHLLAKQYLDAGQPVPEELIKKYAKEDEYAKGVRYMAVGVGLFIGLHLLMGIGLGGVIGVILFCVGFAKYFTSKNRNNQQQD